MTRNQLERVERDGLPGEEIMRRGIEQVADSKPKPTMPEFIQRLWSEHKIKAVVSYYNHGGVRGIKFGIDIGSLNDDGSPRLLWKQGGSLNKYKCSFKKLQSELGISYDPTRDDIEIKAMTQMLDSAPITRDKEKEIDQKTPSISIDNPTKIESNISEKPRLSKEKAQSLYNHYGAEMQDLLVTDRDKETAKRALSDGRDERSVSEIIQASPVGWTKDEAKALVLIASDKMRNKSQTEPEPDKKRQASSLDEVVPSLKVAAIKPASFCGGKFEISSRLSSKEQQLQTELLNVAVPVGMELINRQLREYGENSLRFKHAILKKQGRELVYTHDSRGEVFRVEVSRNQSGELEYSLNSVGEIEEEDIATWRKAERLLQQQIESEIANSQRQSITRNRGRGR